MGARAVAAEEILLSVIQAALLWRRVRPPAWPIPNVKVSALHTRRARVVACCIQTRSRRKRQPKTVATHGDVSTHLAVQSAKLNAVHPRLKNPMARAVAAEEILLSVIKAALIWRRVRPPAWPIPNVKVSALHHRRARVVACCIQTRSRRKRQPKTVATHGDASTKQTASDDHVVRVCSRRGLR